MKSEQRVHRLALPAVEYEHQELVNLINDCYEQMESGADTGTIKQLLNQIYAAVAEHFAHEEELMLSSSYPEYEPHKDSHEQLLLVYRNLIDRFVTNPEAGVERAQKVLADWFIRHVSTADQELHNHFPGSH